MSFRRAKKDRMERRIFYRRRARITQRRRVEFFCRSNKRAGEIQFQSVCKCMQLLSPADACANALTRRWQIKNFLGLTPDFFIYLARVDASRFRSPLRLNLSSLRFAHGPSARTHPAPPAAGRWRRKSGKGREKSLRPFARVTDG